VPQEKNTENAEVSDVQIGDKRARDPDSSFGRIQEPNKRPKKNEEDEMQARNSLLDAQLLLDSGVSSHLQPLILTIDRKTLRSQRSHKV
jgi:hypothetical protein